MATEKQRAAARRMRRDRTSEVRMRHLHFCANEQFPPVDLLRQAVEAERAGFAFSWGADDAAALDGARVWKGAQPNEFYREDWHDPGAIYEHGEEQISETELRQAMIIFSDPDEHVERIQEVEAMGATTVALMNDSGSDPHAAIEVYGRAILPQLSAD